MSKLAERAIEETFMRMLGEKPLSKITIKEIVEECGINRNTFYYHYKDIPDMIERIIQRETDSIIDKYATIETMEKGLEVAAEFALKNRMQVMHIYHSVNRDLYEQNLWKLLDYSIVRAFENIAGELPINPRDREIIINYYKCTCFGLITNWLENEMKNDLVRDFTRLCELNKGHIEMLARHCREAAEQDHEQITKRIPKHI